MCGLRHAIVRLHLFGLHQPGQPLSAHGLGEVFRCGVRVPSVEPALTGVDRRVARYALVLCFRAGDVQPVHRIDGVEFRRSQWCPHQLQCIGAGLQPYMAFHDVCFAGRQALRQTEQLGERVDGGRVLRVRYVGGTIHGVRFNNRVCVVGLLPRGELRKHLGQTVRKVGRIFWPVPVAHNAGLRSGGFVA